MKWFHHPKLTPAIRFISFTSDKKQYRHPAVVLIAGEVKTTQSGNAVLIVAKSSTSPTKEIKQEVKLIGSGLVADFNTAVYLNVDDPLGKYTVTATVETLGAPLIAETSFELI